MRRAEIGLQLRVRHASTTHRAGQTAVFSPPTATATAAALPPIMVSDDLAQQLRTIARDHEATYGGRIARAELRLIDERGNHLTLGVDIDDYLITDIMVQCE